MKFSRILISIVGLLVVAQASHLSAFASASKPRMRKAARTTDPTLQADLDIANKCIEAGIALSGLAMSMRVDATSSAVPHLTSIEMQNCVSAYTVLGQDMGDRTARDLMRHQPSKLFRQEWRKLTLEEVELNIKMMNDQFDSEQRRYMCGTTIRELCETIRLFEAIKLDIERNSLHQ